MQDSHVVTCFIEYEGKILLLKRSRQVGSYQQRWAGVSGYLEPRNTALEQAWEELREEVSLYPADLEIKREGDLVEVIDETLGKKWVVHPFRFLLSRPDKIKTDWEHTEYRWVTPDDIKQYETVPNLYEAWERVK